MRLISERHSHHFQKGFPFFVAFCRCRNYDIHTFDFIDFIVVNLGKNNLLANAQGIVAPAIKGFPRNAFKITDAR